MRSRLHLSAAVVLCLAASAGRSAPGNNKPPIPVLIAGDELDGISVKWDRAAVAYEKELKIPADAKRVEAGHTSVVFNGKGRVSSVSYVLTGSEKGVVVDGKAVAPGATIESIAPLLPGCGPIQFRTGGHVIECHGGDTVLVEEATPNKPLRVVLSIYAPATTRTLAGDKAATLAYLLRASALTKKEKSPTRIVVSVPALSCQQTSRGVYDDGLPQFECSAGDKTVAGGEAVALSDHLAAAGGATDAAMSKSYVQAWQVRCEIDVTGKKDSAGNPRCSFEREEP